MRQCRSLGSVLLLALWFPSCSVLDQLTSPSQLQVQTFTASPTAITTGSVSTLTWNVQGADSVQIDNGIGTVSASGTRSVQLLWTTTFTLTAKSGTATANAATQVQVLPTAPLPSPSPSSSPSPGASPSPGPTPSPTPSPSPKPGPVLPGCGTSAAGWAGSCTVRIAYPTPLPEGQCVQVTNISATPDCPVGGGVNRQITLGVQASTTLSSLSWRAGNSSADVLTPSSGFLPTTGSVNLSVIDNVGDSVMKFEIVDPQGNVLLRLTLSNL